MKDYATMPPYQQRVCDVQKDLAGKIERLNAFLTSDKYNSVDLAEQGRLLQQVGFMNNYNEVLVLRIEAFAEEEDLVAPLIASGAANMKDLVATLPEPYQLLIKMRYYDEKSCEEIAAHYLLPVEGVKADLFVARKLLMKLMPPAPIS